MDPAGALPGGLAGVNSWALGFNDEANDDVVDMGGITSGYPTPGRSMGSTPPGDPKSGFRVDVNEVVDSFKVETAVAAVATNAEPHWKKELTHLLNPDSCSGQ